MILDQQKMRYVWFPLCVGLAFQHVQAAASRVVSYVPGKVYSMRLSPLYATEIKLQGIKRISSIHCGDASVWEIIKPVGSVDSVIIKPLVDQSQTDLIVRADQYNLLFKIQVSPMRNRDPLLLLRVKFPAQRAVSVKKDSLEQAVNRYCYRGDPGLRPNWVYDNNEATYFHWGKYSPAPAIYQMTSDGKSFHMTNFRVKDRVFRAPSVSDRWLLKKGKRIGRLIYFDSNKGGCDG